MQIKAVMFDLIGTTVLEKDSQPITNCFIKAFEANDLIINPEHVRKNRGKDKTDIIKNILSELKYPIDACGAILKDYNSNLEKSIDCFVENSELREIAGYLKEKNIKAGIGTGLSRKFLNNLIKHFKWESIGFDYTSASEEIGRGRPEPDMIYDMMKKFGLKKKEVLKVGDTITDIKEGKNAGVYTAVLLSGTQRTEDLISLKPDYVVGSLIQLKEIIK
jgi:phosphonoacetaldehyde hydrolase